MRYLDASIPLCAIVEEPKKYIQISQKIMRALEFGSLSAVTSVLTIFEIYHILRNRERYTPEDVKDRVLALYDCVGLQIIDAEAEPTKEAIEIATNYKIDLVDAHNYLTMRKHNIKEIYSTDPHYDNFKDIKRII